MIALVLGKDCFLPGNNGRNHNGFTFDVSIVGQTCEDIIFRVF